MREIKVYENQSVAALVPLFYKEDPAFLKDCLESLSGQSRQPDEIVIVTEGVLSPLLIQTLETWRNQHPSLVIKVLDSGDVKGLPACLNVGLAATDCRYIARFDSDDTSIRERLALQLAFLKEHPDVRLLGGQLTEFENDLRTVVGIRSVPLTHSEIVAFSKWRSPFNHQTVMFDRAFVLDSGAYPILPANEDYVLWCTLLSRGARTANLPEVLSHARAGAGLYQRRRGMKYLKGDIRSLVAIRKTGWISGAELVAGVALRVFTRIMPAQLVKRVYLILRK